MKSIDRILTAVGLATALTLVPSLTRADEAPKGVAFVPGTPPFADVLARAKKEGKPVFVEFQASWCGWCRRLEKDVFPQPSVGERMKAFVNVAYDGEKGEGKELAERFRVQGFPTLVVVDANGGEIDRIEGFRQPDDFAKELDRIRRGEDTLPALRQKVEGAPEDLAATLALARKLTVAAPTEAVALLGKTVEKAKSKDRRLEAEAWISLARAARNANDDQRAKAACDHVLAEFADTDYAAEALQAMVPPDDPEAALALLVKVRKDSKNARVSAYADAVVAEVHLRAAAAALKRRAEASSDDPQTLNEIAWTCFERKMNLKAAVGWARKAADASKRDPAILDTLANLLFATGMADEALKTEQEALEGAKSEPLKAEVGETLARFKAAVAFRKDHPLEMAAGGVEDDEDGAATEPRNEDNGNPGSRAKAPATAGSK